MTRQARFRWALALGSLLLVVCSAIRILHWNSEEFAIYEVTIRETFSGDDVSHYVILDTTEPAGRFGISNFHSERLGLPLSARASYTTKNFFRFHVPPRFRLPHLFTMVSQEQLDKTYRPGQTDSPNAVELGALLRKSWGVITLSRVGFDLGGKHAVVHAQLTYCGLCGEGTYLYLSKETGAWHIVGRAGTWISQDFEWYDHGTQTKWPELNRIRPAIPTYVSLLNVWSRIKPFTDETPHFALLANRHLFSTAVIITEI
ncbi:MAG: hypothetical protein WCD34_13825, partial [Candidatus Acidiferrum sp.]